MKIKKIVTTLADNPWLLKLAVSVPRRVYNEILRRSTYEIEIDGSDRAFYYITRWLSEHEGAKKARTLKLSTMRRSDNDYVDEDNREEDKWFFSPTDSVFFIDEGLPVWVYRGNRDPIQGGGYGEFITIRVLAKDTTAIERLMTKAAKFAKKDNEQSIYVYGTYWNTYNTKLPRDINTVILPPEQKARILKDIEWFNNSREWYKSRGIPYHRGYLFCGPPGTGKTSLVSALAGHIGRDIAVLPVGSCKSDESLLNAIISAPKNAIISLEDIDCATEAAAKRSKDDKGKKEGVTLAGLLNALDGSATPDGRIFMLTTNHPDTLDPALLRPGRVDVKEVLGLMSKEQQIEMSKLYFDEPFSIDKEVSPAAMQGILMHNALDREAAFAELKKLEV